MSFDPGSLLLSVLLGSVGFVLFVYGKKQDRWPQLAAGVAYMVYPYFFDNVLVDLGIGIGIAVVLWWAIRQGY